MAAKVNLPDFKYEIRHELAIYEFTCPHPDVSRLLGIRPSKAWNKGERWEGRPQRLYRVSGWLYETPVIHTDTAGKNAGIHVPSLETLIEMVHSVRQRLSEIPGTPLISVATIIHADTFNASMLITPKMMRLLAEANVDYIYDPFLGHSV